MLQPWLDAFAQAQLWLFETLVQPLVFGIGMGHLLEDAFNATGWLLVGLVQLALMLVILVPLECWRPVEPVHDRAAIRTDILYTLLHRLGLFRLALFFLLDPLLDQLFGLARLQGLSAVQLDQLLGLAQWPLLSFLLYLVVLDFADYWIHRGQHHLNWWLSLHALHHSQRQMTLWSDNRNHLLDDLLRDAILAVLAQLIGIAPAQFVALVAFTQLSESLQHANLRLWFGPIGERLWVSPRFHRRHHSIGLGHERAGPAPSLGTHVTQAPARLGGCNFGVLLPCWDLLFGTADWALRYERTGIRDQVEPDAQGRLRDYGQGFWAQQWRGLLRLWGRA